MRLERLDLRTLSGHKIAVIGPGTAERLKEAGLYADYMPEVYDAAHLAEGLSDIIMAEQEKERPGSTGWGAKQGDVSSGKAGKRCAVTNFP